MVSAARIRRPSVIHRLDLVGNVRRGLEPGGSHRRTGSTRTAPARFPARIGGLGGVSADDWRGLDEVQSGFRRGTSA
jgi:hypothetical protein